MRGRYPAGIEYVDKVEGSPQAKKRARLVLEILSGNKRLEEVRSMLGIGKTRLFLIRHQAVQALVQALEPGMPGRPTRTPPPEAERLRELQDALCDKDLELKEAEVRTEVALILAGSRGDDASEKKGQRRKQSRYRPNKPR